MMLIWKILVTHSLVVSKMACGWPIPALLIRIVGSPSSERTFFAASAMEAGDVTSHLTYKIRRSVQIVSNSDVVQVKRTYYAQAQQEELGCQGQLLERPSPEVA